MYILTTINIIYLSVPDFLKDRDGMIQLEPLTCKKRHGGAVIGVGG